MGELLKRERLAEARQRGLSVQVIRRDDAMEAIEYARSTACDLRFTSEQVRQVLDCFDDGDEGQLKVRREETTRNKVYRECE